MLCAALLDVLTHFPVKAIPASSRLEQLPAELISLIFVHLYQSLEKHKVLLIKDPISKSLLPYIRRNLFQNLTFSTITRFVRFCTDTTGIAGIVESVQRLQVCCRRLELLATTDEHPILAFFASATALRRLQSSHPNLSRLVLSTRFAQALPSNSTIDTLDVRNVLRENGSSLSERLRCIASWRSLRAVEIGYKTGSAGRVDSRASAEGDVPRIQHSRIKRLRLSVNAATEEVVRFLADFPRLEELVFQTKTTADFATVLETLDK